MASPATKLIICASGIFICYFYYGILQERITRSTYGENDKFTYVMTLILIQCIVNCLCAKILLHTLMKEEEDLTRQSLYSVCAFTYLGAMVMTNMSLQHVNYPTQVVGKSCKPIPVMILGVLYAKKRYPLIKYFFVFMIVVGIVLFMYKDRPASSSLKDPEAAIIGIGEILLLISLGLDGITGGIQDRIRAEHKPQAVHMMFFINMWAVLYLGIIVLITGEVFQFVSFVNLYPNIIYDVILFSVTSAVGQIFIYQTVANFGPLPCSIITTTRKFFTVIGSVLLFGNSLTNRQWLGTLLVFIGLTLDSVYGKTPPKKEEEKKPKD